MSNPSNLLRPAVLNPEQVPPQINAALQQQISSLVAEQVRATLQVLNNTNDDLGGGLDVVIEERYRNNLTELDKIPDIVRCLREYSGKPAEFNSWKKSVERVLEIYDNIKGSAKYFGILSVIRNKIIGNADAALESYNTPLNWKNIVKCLTLHYGDKRNLSTLEYQMTTLIQGRNTIQDFYQEVYTHLSLILNKIGCMDVSRESTILLTQTYRDKALDTFIRGLNGELPKLLGIREPSDLPQALHLCLKLENQNFRTNYAHNRRPVHTPAQNISTFHPELAHIPSPPRQRKLVEHVQRQQPFHSFSQYRNQGAIPRHTQYYHNNNFGPPRPFAPRPQQRPEPMDVDQSIRTRNINMNRPANNDFFGKRPPLPQPEGRKQTRNFHLCLETDNNTNKHDVDGLNDHLQGLKEENEIDGQSFDDYLNGQGDYKRELDQED